MKERLQKIIAAAGICSRRAAEELLRQGRVRVNGQPAALGDQADPESDIVTVDGLPLLSEETRTAKSNFLIKSNRKRVNHW